MQNILLKNYLVTLAVILFFAIFSKSVYSQGCSDAGVCSIGKIHTDNEQMVDEFKNSISIGMNYGKADHGISVVGSNLSYFYQYSKTTNIQFRIDYLRQHSELHTSTGLADVYAVISHQVTPQFYISGGVKIPMQDGGTKEKGVGLPMDFQNSLGTWDALFSSGYAIGDFNFNASLQIPISNNKNTFLPENYPANSTFQKFKPGNGFVRKPDALLRITYQMYQNKDIQIYSGILPILHLSTDEYVDKEGKKIKLTGSDGLTLNLFSKLKYAVNERVSFEGSVAFPVKTRISRPDGLTRAFVIGFDCTTEF